jgi:hypothetical protein
MQNALAAVKQHLFVQVALALLEQTFRVYYPAAIAPAATTVIYLHRQTASVAAINVARAAIVVPATRAQSLAQTHQPVHAAAVNKTTERALCVEVRLVKTNFKINIHLSKPVRTPANPALQTQFPPVQPVMAPAVRTVHGYCLLAPALH